MNRLIIHPKKQTEKERVSRQQAMLAAHQWSELTNNENRWAVYPNQPKKIYAFPTWNPDWPTTNGKL